MNQGLSHSKQVIQKYQQALRTLYGKQQENTHTIEQLKTENSELTKQVRKAESPEELVKRKILERQVDTLSKDLNSAAKRYEELIERLKDSRKKLSQLQKKLKIFQVAAVATFSTCIFLVWQDSRSNLTIKENQIVLNSLNEKNNLLTEENLQMMSQKSSLEKKIADKYETKLNQFSEKISTLEKTVTDSQELAQEQIKDFKSQLNMVHQEYQVKINLIQNKFENKIETLTKEKEKALSDLAQTQLITPNVIVIEEKTPMESTEVIKESLEPNVAKEVKQTRFLNALREIKKEQQEKYPPLKNNVSSKGGKVPSLIDSFIAQGADKQDFIAPQAQPSLIPPLPSQQKLIP